MKEFTYTIRDEIGIHARPAGLLVKMAKKYESNITLSINGKSAGAKSLFAIMGLGAKNNDNVTVTAEGVDESDAINEIKAFFDENL